MYTQSYEDFTELDKEVAAFKRQLNEEYLAGERAKREAAGSAALPKRTSSLSAPA